MIEFKGEMIGKAKKFILGRHIPGPWLWQGSAEAIGENRRGAWLWQTGMVVPGLESSQY